jgi:uncharacterized membrane protein YhhN
MNAALFLALGCAVIDWFAVARENKTLEWVFKPATMLIIIFAARFAMQNAQDIWLAQFFILGFLLSLAGDVLLMIPHERAFLLGLIAFLSAHVAYIVGMNAALPPLHALVLLIPIGILDSWFVMRVVRALRASEQSALVTPIMIYAAIISLMLFSAWATLFRPEWTTARRTVVIIGATLFFCSDAMLAWNRFVKSFRCGKVLIMITYHLGQIALATAIAF